MERDRRARLTAWRSGGRAALREAEERAEVPGAGETRQVQAGQGGLPVTGGAGEYDRAVTGDNGAAMHSQNFALMKESAESRAEEHQQNHARVGAGIDVTGLDDAGIDDPELDHAGLGDSNAANLADPVR